VTTTIKSQEGGSATKLSRMNFYLISSFNKPDILTKSYLFLQSPFTLRLP